MRLRLICRENRGYNLTIGKVYDCWSYKGACLNSNDYILYNDNNGQCLYRKDMFMSIKEYRKLKLEKLNKYEM